MFTFLTGTSTITQDSRSVVRIQVISPTHPPVNIVHVTEGNGFFSFFGR